MPVLLALILIFLPPQDENTSESPAVNTPVIQAPKAGEKKHGPRIAIIIDDLGYRLRESQQSIKLNASLTVAIIPESPYAQRLAEEAKESGNKEILVHLPMAPNQQITWENGLTTAMEKEEFKAHARKLLTSFPHAIGVNNHGGSLLTQDRERMAWLMSVLVEKKLFFIDSRTTANSVAAEIAAQALVPFSSRDVFLDNHRDQQAIENQLDKLLALATLHGEAVAIGHPYPETLAVLKARLPEIQQQGFTLVGISQLLDIHLENSVSARQKTRNSTQKFSSLVISQP